MSYLKRLVLFSAVALVLAVPAFSTPAVDLKPGDKAPDFSLQGTDGKTYKLSDLAGKTVVVAWFPKAFTGGCTKECKSLKESGEAIRAYDVKYFAAMSAAAVSGFTSLSIAEIVPSAAM